MPAQKPKKPTKVIAPKKTKKPEVKEKKAVKPVPQKTVQKIIKKTAEIKAPAKKTVKKPVLVTSSNEQSFWVNNGPVLNSLESLYEALMTLSPEQFAFHSNGEQNHFSLWVGSVLLDKDCAKALKKTKTQKEASKVVKEALKKYRS